MQQALLIKFSLLLALVDTFLIAHHQLPVTTKLLILDPAIPFFMPSGDFRRSPHAMPRTQHSYPLPPCPPKVLWERWVRQWLVLLSSIWPALRLLGAEGAAFWGQEEKNDRKSFSSASPETLHPLQAYT